MTNERKSTNLTIDKVANGFVVRPDYSRREGYGIEPSEMFVFNVVGKAAEKDSEGRLTLAGFIAKYFKDPPA